MSGQLDPGLFSGAHPSAGEFVELLVAWGFRRRKDAGTHLVFRGPHGGVLRMPRQTSGRANPVQVSKAARLANVSVARLLAGPLAEPEQTAAPVEVAVERRVATPTVPARHKGGRRSNNGRDSLNVRVLAVHSTAGRPLSFEEVAAACGGGVTRQQVVQASSRLRRDGHLERVRTGYYQWPTDVPQVDEQPAPVIPPPAAVTALRPTPAGSDRSGQDHTARMLDQMFPDGLPAMSSAEFVELRAYIERGAALTERLSGHAKAS